MGRLLRLVWGIYVFILTLGLSFCLVLFIFAAALFGRISRTLILLLPFSLTIILFLLLFFHAFRRKRERFSTYPSFNSWILLLDFAVIAMAILSMLLYAALTPRMNLVRLSRIPFSLTSLYELLVPGLFYFEYFRFHVFAACFAFVSVLLMFTWRRWLKKRVESRYEFPLGMASGAVLGILIFFAGIVIINRFDARRAPPVFSLKDLPPADPVFQNGYYIILAFAEPPGVDISNPRVLAKYQKLFANPAAGDCAHEEALEKKNRRQFQGTLPAGGENLVEACLAQQEKIRKAQSDNAALLDRYQRLLHAEKMEEFLLPSQYLSCFSQMIPNIRSVYLSSQLFLDLNVLRAVQGHWREGVEQILDGMAAVREWTRNSRTKETFFLGINILRRSLEALSSLMKRRECPGQLIEHVFARLCQFNLYSLDLSKVWIFKYLTMLDLLDRLHRKRYIRLFETDEVPSWLLFISAFQKNRTKSYFGIFFRDLMEMQKLLPYQTGTDSTLIELCMVKKAWSHWLVNLAGKHLFFHLLEREYMDSALGSLATFRVRYDLTLILAEMYMKYDSKLSFQQNLEMLDSFKAIDPFSGKPYRFNSELKVIYSVGRDRRDDGGAPDSSKNLRDIIVQFRMKAE